MSVQYGAGSAEDHRLADPLRDSSLHMFAHLYESYAASLFDYCDGLLRETFAASDAVQDSLVAADAQVSFPPNPEWLRILLYSGARRECLSRLPGARGRLSGHAPTVTLEELGAAVPDFEVAGAAGETLVVLKAALESLSEHDRDVLSLVFRHRLTAGDLATVLGVGPRRAQALLSQASARFERSAPVIAVLRAAFREGRPRCSALGRVLRAPDLASLALTPELRKQVARHVESCPDCARSRRGRSFAAEQVSEIPLVIPPGRIRLRLTRTAHALGSYRRKTAGGAQEPDGRRRHTGKHSKAGHARS
jgi:RNA polymerase sigma factor (sigma-70 family)